MWIKPEPAGWEPWTLPLCYAYTFSGFEPRLARWEAWTLSPPRIWGLVLCTKTRLNKKWARTSLLDQEMTNWDASDSLYFFSIKTVGYRRRFRRRFQRRFRSSSQTASVPFSRSGKKIVSGKINSSGPVWEKNRFYLFWQNMMNCGAQFWLFWKEWQRSLFLKQSEIYILLCRVAKTLKRQLVFRKIDWFLYLVNG